MPRLYVGHGLICKDETGPLLRMSFFGSFFFSFFTQGNSLEPTWLSQPPLNRYSWHSAVRQEGLHLSWLRWAWLIRKVVERRPNPAPLEPARANPCGFEPALTGFNPAKTAELGPTGSSNFGVA